MHKENKETMKVSVPMIVAFLQHKEAKLFFSEVICICHRKVTLTDASRESINPVNPKKWPQMSYKSLCDHSYKPKASPHSYFFKNM